MADALHTPGVTSAAEARFDDAGLIAVGAGGLTSARTGVLAGPGSTALVTGTSSTSPMRYSVAAHHWVTSRGVTSDGVYRGGAEAAVLVDTTAAPGSGSRIDVLWVKQQDATSTISADGSTAPQYGCTQGTPSTGTPAVPSIPTGAEELARVTVTSAATRTDGAGVTITQTARQTVARGASVPVRSLAERNALDKYPGLTVLRLDTADIREERWNGTNWCFQLSGSLTSTFNGSVWSIVSGSDGLYSFAHGGGRAPTDWSVSLPQQPTDAISLVLDLVEWGADATNLVIRTRREDTNGWFGGTPFNLKWRGWWG